VRLDVEYIKTLEPKIVLEPPQQLLEFRRLSGKDKREKSKKFFSQDKIKEYLDEKWAFELFNREKFKWLFRALDSADEESVKVIVRKKIRVFYDTIVSQPRKYDALLVDFSEYDIPPDRAVEELNVAVKAYVDD
jgi:hypothetical protein